MIMLSTRSIKQHYVKIHPNHQLRGSRPSRHPTRREAKYGHAMHRISNGILYFKMFIKRLMHKSNYYKLTIASICETPLLIPN